MAKIGHQAKHKFFKKIIAHLGSYIGYKACTTSGVIELEVDDRVIVKDVKISNQIRNQVILIFMRQFLF